MQKLKDYFRKSPAIVVAVILLALTLFTSFASIAKVAGSFTGRDTEIEVPEVKGSEPEDSESENEDEADEDVSELETEDEVVDDISEGTPGITTAPSTPNSLLANLTRLSPTPLAGVNEAGSNIPSSGNGDNSGRCIITVFGKSYDVTPLQTSHPGGNVFVCGADNSSAYQSAHGTNVSRIQPYLVTTNTGSTGSSGNQTTPVPTPGSGNFEFEDDDESERELEEQKKLFEKALEDAKNELENEHEAED